MKPKIIGVYSIIIGISIIILWVGILLSNSISEGSIEISFHLVSELLMAISCIISGFLILKESKLGKGLNIIAHGMVLYSVLNATGYYGQKGYFLFIIVFLILFFLSSLVLIYHLKTS